MGLLEDLRWADSYYEATVKRPPPAPVLCGRQEVEVGVVGGGLAGLSTALALAESGVSVALLEARRIGAVASGRNGGQVLAGLACAPDVIEAQLGLPAAQQVWRMTVDAVSLVRERIQRYGIQADTGEGAIVVSLSERGARNLHREMQSLTEVYGLQGLEWLEGSRLRERVCSQRYVAGWRDPHGMHLHPLKYALGLAEAALKLGVQIYEGSEVTRVEPGHPVVLHTRQGQLVCRTAVLAGGAPLGQNIPPFDRLTMPYDSWIIGTEPLSAEQIARTIPARESVYDDSYDIDYYRITPEGRLLFGSGAHYLAGSREAARRFLQQRMLRVFPELENTRIEHLWGGIMEIPLNRAPVMGRLLPNVLHIQGFGGHGVAFTGYAGVLAAEAVTGRSDGFDLLSHIRHRRFPFGRWLQVPMMMAGIYWYRAREALGGGGRG